MDEIREYLFQLLAAAIIFGTAIKLVPGKGPTSALIKLLCSVLMVICAVKPIPQFDFNLLDTAQAEIMLDAEAAVASGENTVRQMLSESIIEQTEAYILEKAKEMDVDLAVQVEVSEDEIPMPVSVCLSGKISPYVKTQLSNMITQDLGVSKEYQVWK